MEEKAGQPGDLLRNNSTTMTSTRSSRTDEQSIASSKIPGECDRLGSQKTRGDLGGVIATIVLAYSPRDLQQMKWNFSEKIRDISPGYRKRLEETITGYLHGTYQNVRRTSRVRSLQCMSLYRRMPRRTGRWPPRSARQAMMGKAGSGS